MEERETRIRDLSVDQRVALERQLLARLSQDKQRISPRQSEGPCPLSFAQQRLWFLEQLEGELTAYNMSTAWRLCGTLRAEALRRALETIVRRHQPLRTTFEMLEGKPVQIVRSIERFDVPVEDLDSLEPAQQEEVLGRRRREEAERPFDLSADLMLRARLLRLGKDEHVLLLTVHHIASDGWSWRVIYRELRTLYDAYCRDADAELPPLPIHYSDYAVWQRKELEGETLSRLLEYWRGQLDGLSTLELPTDRPRPPRPSYHGSRHVFVLGEELARQLKLLTQSEGVTLHMVLLAAFQLLLARYSGQDDVAAAVPIAGRNDAEIEGLIGFFVNTLALRTDLSGDPLFRELIGRVREVSLAAYDHQDLPFEKLVEDLQPQRHLSRNPLVQVLFQLLDFPNTDLTLRDLTVSRLPSCSQRARFDLEMHLWQQPDSLRGAVVYSTDLFDASTIERMAGHFVTLLEGIVKDADRKISQLPLLTDPERRRLLLEWNGTAVEHPSDGCVHELFERQVQRTPETVAVVFEDQRLTYRELNDRANRLAHYLQSRGVGPDSLVGLCLERSVDLVVGILGILKAGAAYVPLDADYPRDRLEFMLTDADVACLVTQQSLLDRLPTCTGELVCVDAEAANLNSQACSNPSACVDPSHLAYVIYTSGSTGRPKGVAMAHRPLVNLIQWQRRDRRLGRAARTLQFASFSFDVSFQEILGTLSSGGTLFLVSEALRLDPRLLWSFIVESGIERLFVPFVALQQLAIAASSAPAELRDIVSAGEVLQLTPEIRSLLSGLPDCRLHNHYGPTETHVVTSHVLEDKPDAWPAAASIGRPIANTQVYVLDERRQPVPIGVPGELYIGGAALARGYLNRPELTAERFVTDPFSREADSQMYRTGDQVRWRDDGNLEFLGRIDDQVKLRGFRIELGEIEAVLTAHPSVSQSVVVLREDRPGDRRLVAYCVPVDHSEPNFAELTRHLRGALPDYMVPSAFVALNALPLTPSGKINRRVLPAPDDSRPDLQTEFVAPRNPLEEQLAAIWCEVLGVERVGIYDSFFALGGHSLLATQVMARVSAVLQVDLPLRTLFEVLTIKELAARIDSLRRGEMTSASTPLTRVDREHEQLPLSFAQQRLWFLEHLEGELTAYNMPAALRLCGTLDAEALRRALEAIVDRHEPLRTAIQMVDGEPVQVVRTIERFDMPVVDLGSLDAQRQEDELVQRCREEAERPFDLTADLMLRARLLRLDKDRHVLLLTVHHIATDGWSMQVFYRELSSLYDAYSRGANAMLPELSICYADYTLWQRHNLKGERLEGLLQYWRSQLDGLNALELAADRSRLPRPSYRGAKHRFALGEELVCQLRSLAQAEGVTLHMVLMAAFQTLLARYSGQDDIAVGVPTAGRSHADLEGLIGFFVNTLVLRTDLSGNPTFRELLSHVRHVSLAAYDHQDLPFEKLVEELQPQRDAGRHPLVQVVFQLLSFPDAKLTLRELEVSRLPSPGQRVRFDLEMHVWQQPNGLHGTVVYSTDLFDASTIERMVGHFVTLLEGIVADADQRISDLPMLADAERHQLLVEWNDTAAAYPRDKCIHELFEEQVKRTPEAVAVEFEGESLTYRQLNVQANQWADYLRGLGVGNESLVGICMERSPEMVVGLLGILKAGGAYVPLDPSYPQQRLMTMLDDASATVLLTKRSFLDRLPQTGLTIVCFDDDYGAITGASKTNPAPAGSGESLAYVMYTSGSTGQPKGVAVPHRAVARLVINTDYVTLNETDVIAHVSNVAFDAATFEIWGALLSGSKLVILTKEEVLSPADFADLLRRRGITTLFITTALFHQFAREIPSIFGTLRQVLFGGEAVDPACVRAVLRNGPPQRLLHVYGPTETTTFATWYEVKEVAERARTVPIGRPIRNARVYVLDSQQRPVPTGVAGELYIGGDGLAREYLNSPELTAEKFTLCPFGLKADDRLYRTGDRVRWRQDGNLEFLGRQDSQIKLRGYRIELAEIEAALSDHPDVGQCVVVLHHGGAEDARLLAYYVRSSTAAATSESAKRTRRRSQATTEPLDLSEQLASHLHTRLPDYMVPSAFVELPSLPLTPNGKIDRDKLPVPESSGRGAAYRPPINAVQSQLVRIWEDVLNVERVGIGDNFFQLGGHSLLLIKVIAAMRECFQQPFSPSIILQYPTIAKLAARVSRYVTPDNNVIVPLSLSGTGLPVFWAHSFHVGALIEHALRGKHRLYLLKSQGADGRPARLWDVASLAKHYADEIQVVAKHGPYILGGYSFGAVVMLEVARQMLDRGEAVNCLFLIDPTPFRASGGKPKPFFSAWRDTADAIMRSLRLAEIRLHVMLRGELPLHSRRFYERHVFRRCLRGYQPKPLAGLTNTFITTGKSAGDSTDWGGWHPLLSGDVVHRPLPDYAHHSIVDPDSAGKWLEELTRMLDNQTT